MVIKNGRLFYKLGIKSGTTKANKIVVKNGFIFHKLGNAAAGYGQKVLSIASANVNKIIGVARTAISKVIGVE